MINPVYFNIAHQDGSKRSIIIEPVLERSNGGIKATGSYKLYKTSIDNESLLFTEKLEIDEKNDDLPDEKNPDYLGTLTMDAGGKWQYKGDLLNRAEQEQVAKYINTNA
jgi:hypothetical protein